VGGARVRTEGPRSSDSLGRGSKGGQKKHNSAIQRSSSGLITSTFRRKGGRIVCGGGGCGGGRGIMGQNRYKKKRTSLPGAEQKQPNRRGGQVKGLIKKTGGGPEPLQGNAIRHWRPCNPDTRKKATKCAKKGSRGSQ